MSWCEHCRTLEERVQKLDREKARAQACATEAEKQLIAMRADRDATRTQLFQLQRLTAQRNLF